MVGLCAGTVFAGPASDVPEAPHLLGSLAYLGDRRAGFPRRSDLLIGAGSHLLYGCGHLPAARRDLLGDCGLLFGRAGEGLRYLYQGLPNGRLVRCGGDMKTMSAVSLSCHHLSR